MFCQPKRCRSEKTAMEKLSTAMMFTGGLLATAYFGYKLFEKIKCKCKSKTDCDCGCEDEPILHEYDHVSENDCLCHDKKDYYNQCGCFDSEDGTPANYEGKNGEEEP